MSAPVSRGTWLRANTGLALWALFAAVTVVAFVAAVDEDAPRSGVVITLAVMGALALPVRIPGVQLPARLSERLGGAFSLVALGIAYHAARGLFAAHVAAPGYLDIGCGLALFFSALAMSDALPRVLRLMGIELTKAWRSRIWQVALIATALVTLLAAWLRTPIEGDTGWSIAVQNVGTGMWAAELFILVLGATTVAGELGQGTLKMILPHAYRRSEWVIAKGLVLLLTATILTAIVALVALLHGQLAHGLGDVVKEVPAGFGEEEGGVEVFQTAAVMGSHLFDAVLSGLGVLGATALIGLLFSCLFDSVVPALSAGFLFFLGLKSADVLLGLPRDVLRDVYATYPGTLREWTQKLGRGLNETWDPKLLEAGLLLALLTGMLAWLVSIAWFSRRDLHG